MPAANASCSCHSFERGGAYGETQQGTSPRTSKYTFKMQLLAVSCFNMAPPVDLSSLDVPTCCGS